MSIGNNNLSTLLSLTSLVGSYASPATQMIFSGTGSGSGIGSSIFNSIFGSYGLSGTCCTGNILSQVSSMSTKSLFGWAGAIATLAGLFGIGLNAVQHRKQKKAEVAQAKNNYTIQKTNVKGIEDQIKALEKENTTLGGEDGKGGEIGTLKGENKKLNDYLNDIDNNLSALETDFPTETKAYKGSLDKYNKFNGKTAYDVSPYKDDIASIKNNIAPDKQGAEITKIEQKFNADKTAAEEAKKAALEKLEEAIRAKISANETEISTKTEKYNANKDKIEELEGKLIDEKAKLKEITNITDEDTLDDLDGCFLGRKGAGKVESKFDYNNKLKSSEEVTKRDLKTAIYNFRTATDPKDKKDWAEKFKAMYNYTAKHNTSLFNEFKDAAEAIDRYLED